MTKIIIAELDLNTEALTKKAVVTKKAIQDLKDAQKILKIQGDQNSKAFVKNEIALKKLTTSYREQTKVLSSLTDENDEFIQTEKAINTAVEKNITTISQARKSNKELLAIRNELNLSTVEGQNQLTKINAKLDSNNKIIKENVSGYEKQKIGIGDYTGALDKFFPRLGSVVKQGLAFKKGLVSQRAALKASTTATGAGSKALKIFRIALISTGIGAIVVAIGALIAAFSSTQKGADAISKALAPIKGAFQGIIGVIQDIALNVFGQLGDRFLLVKNAILIGIDLIRLGWNKLTGDTEEAAEIQERITKRLNESVEAQGRLNEKTAKLVSIFKGAGDRIREAAKAQQRMVDLTIQIEKAENRLIVSRSISNRIIKESNKIAEDTTQTLEDREAAAKRAIQESNNLLRAEQHILDLKIEQKKLEQSQNDTSRADKKELAELEAKRNEVETQQLELQTTLTNKLNIIRKQAETEQLKIIQERTDLLIEQAQIELDIFKSTHQKKLEANTFFNEELLSQEQERLDALLAKETSFQNIKLQNGVISQQEFNTAINAVNTEDRVRREEAQLLRDEAEKEKKAIDLDNQRLIEEENFLSKFEVQSSRLEVQRQKELEVAKKTGADIDLINKRFESRKIKLNELAEEEKRKNAASTFGEIASLLGQQSVLGKAAALAEAGINVQVGVTKAIAQGGLAGLVTGAIVAAKGALTISKIAGFDGGGKAIDMSSGKGGRVTGSPNIPTQKGGDNMLATIKTNEVILNDEQQRRAGGSAFFASIGVPGFATGGVGGVNSTVTAPIQKANSDVSNLANQIVEGINNIKIVTVVDEVTNAQAIQTDIVSGANI